MRRKTLAIAAALLSVAFVAGFVAADLYLWPQLRWPAAVLGASLFCMLFLAGIGAAVYHLVNESDGHVEARIKAEKDSWLIPLRRHEEASRSDPQSASATPR